MIRALALTVALSLAACGGSSRSTPPPAEPTPPAPAPAPAAEPAAACAEGETPPGPMLTRDEAESKGIAMMEEMGTLFERNATDCKALASALRAWVRENCTLLLRMKAFADTQTQAEKDEFDAKYGDKMMAIGMKMMPAMNNCSNDPDLEAALDEVPR